MCFLSLITLCHRRSDPLALLSVTFTLLHSCWSCRGAACSHQSEAACVQNLSSCRSYKEDNRNCGLGFSKTGCSACSLKHLATGVSVCVTAALLLTDSCRRSSGRRTSEKTTVATQTTPPLGRGALPLTPGHTSDTRSAAYHSVHRVGYTHTQNMFCIHLTDIHLKIMPISCCKLLPD